MCSTLARVFVCVFVVGSSRSDSREWDNHRWTKITQARAALPSSATRPSCSLARNTWRRRQAARPVAKSQLGRAGSTRWLRRALVGRDRRGRPHKVEPTMTAGSHSSGGCGNSSNSNNNTSARPQTGSTSVARSCARRAPRPVCHPLWCG
jgi:hypothetical protein